MTCSCDIITNELLVAYALSMQSSCDLVLALLCTWTVNNMLRSNNNYCLRSCSHNYQFIYCCYGIAIANEASACKLTFRWTQFEFVSLWRSGIILLTLLSLKQSVSQLHLNETIDLTIRQLVFSFSYYVWKQPKMMNEKDSTAIHCMCRQFV